MFVNQIKLKMLSAHLLGASKFRLSAPEEQMRRFLRRTARVFSAVVVVIILQTMIQPLAAPGIGLFAVHCSGA